MVYCRGVVVRVSCDCYRLQKYKNNFKKKLFVTFFFFCFTLIFQKDSFCIPKGLVLEIRWISSEK